MIEENKKFVEEMLKRAEEKKETKPQKRYSDDDKEEVENLVDELINPSKKEKKEE